MKTFLPAKFHHLTPMIIGMVLIIAACTKQEEQPAPTPFKMTIKPNKDSLTLRPVTFDLDVNMPAESYEWTFPGGVKTTTTNPSVTHIFQYMGAFSLHCEARLNEKTYYADTRFIINGDGRIVGEKHFYGTHTYDYSPSEIWPQQLHMAWTITDTIINIKAENSNGPTLSFLGSSAPFFNETPTEIVYKTNFHGITSLTYYPQNDSITLTLSDNGSSGAYASKWDLKQKK